MKGDAWLRSVVSDGNIEQQGNINCERSIFVHDHSLFTMIARTVFCLTSILWQNCRNALEFKGVYEYLFFIWGWEIIFGKCECSTYMPLLWF